MLHPLYKRQNIQIKGAERGGWWGRQFNLCVGSVYKHSLQLKDPTQRIDAR